MFKRHLYSTISSALDSQAAVALLGPRQVGKTTLALEIAATRPSIYLDLEREDDRLQLDDPAWWLGRHSDKLVILDEVHRLPGLFPILRGIIDEGRRQGMGTGRFLILGSASLDLLKQSGESLAGRISYLELPPLRFTEATTMSQDVQWLRGGYPGSLLATSESISESWRRSFIRTYAERELPAFGISLPAVTIERLWQMLAHRHGAILNISEVSRSIGVHTHAIARYVDLLCGMFLFRKLPAYHANVGKRLMRTPKLLMRDTGLLHSMLRIDSLDALAAHPMLGVSWEGFVIDQIVSLLPWPASGYYYRTRAGAEIDLVIEWSPDDRWGIEIKRSSLKLERGFHEACEDLKVTRKILIQGSEREMMLNHKVEAISLSAFLKQLQAVQ